MSETFHYLRLTLWKRGFWIRGVKLIMLNMHGFQITVANVYQPGKKQKKMKSKGAIVYSYAICQILYFTYIQCISNGIWLKYYIFACILKTFIWFFDFKIYSCTVFGQNGENSFILSWKKWKMKNGSMVSVPQAGLAKNMLVSIMEANFCKLVTRIIY